MFKTSYCLILIKTYFPVIECTFHRTFYIICTISDDDIMINPKYSSINKLFHYTIQTQKSLHHQARAQTQLTLRIVNKVKSREVPSCWSFAFLLVFLKNKGTIIIIVHSTGQYDHEWKDSSGALVDHHLTRGLLFTNMIC